jgi:hypothetical protein
MRDLERQVDFSGAQAPVHLGMVAQRRPLDEVAGAGKVEHVVAAQAVLSVAIEHGKAEVLDVHVDAVAQHQHEQDAAQQRPARAGSDRGSVPATRVGCS